MTFDADYPHLSADARAVIDADDEARTRFIWTDRWIDYPAGRAAIGAVTTHVGRPRQLRPVSMLFHAPPDMGKSAIIRQILAELAVQETPTGRRMPVLAIQAPPAATERRLYAEILAALGLGRLATSTAASSRLALSSMQKLEVQALLIDEIQHIVELPSHHRRTALATLKFISNSLGASIIGFGSGDSREVVTSDPHLQARFEIRELVRWRPSDWYFVVFRDIVASLPLRRRTIVDEGFLTLVYTRSDGVPGRLFRDMRLAAEAAIRDGSECLLPQHFTDRPRNG